MLDIALEGGDGTGYRGAESSKWRLLHLRETVITVSKADLMKVTTYNLPDDPLHLSLSAPQPEEVLLVTSLVQISVCAEDSSSVALGPASGAGWGEGSWSRGHFFPLETLTCSV